MADEVNIGIVEDAVNIEVEGTATWDSLAGKPTPVAQNSFIVSDASLDWVVKTLAEVQAILGITNTMKYLDTINLNIGANDITTTVTTEPYNVLLLDSSGNDITSLVTISIALVGLVYHVYISTVDVLNNVKLKILY